MTTPAAPPPPPPLAALGREHGLPHLAITGVEALVRRLRGRRTERVILRISQGLAPAEAS
jgi:hypothetical protein